MKFYDLEWLAEKCGTDNKYEITAKIAAEARRESEDVSFHRVEVSKDKDERFISNVLEEIEEDRSPISVNYQPPKAPEIKIPDFDEFINKDSGENKAKEEVVTDKKSEDATETETEDKKSEAEATESEANE